MVNVGLKGVRVLYRINKDEGNESVSSTLKRCCQCDFSEILGRSFSSCLGLRNIPSDVCYDDTKY